MKTRFAECVCPPAGLVGWEGDAMTHAIYLWQAAYRSAVFETDPKQLSIRINEARRANGVNQDLAHERNKA